LVVEFGLVQGSTTAATPEEYFQGSIVETVRQRAEIYKVGPYFTGSTPPTWNADGTPYGVVTPPVVEEPAVEEEAV
jgi:hypothetical protein